MVVALGTDVEILHEGQLVDNLAAIGAFLPESLRHFAFPAVGVEGRFLEDGHRSGGPAWKGASAARDGNRPDGSRTCLEQNECAFIQGGPRRQDIVHENQVMAAHGDTLPHPEGIPQVFHAPLAVVGKLAGGIAGAQEAI
jgi:hypothetical protein